MWAGSVWLPSSSGERERIEVFFRNLGRPITREDFPEKRTISPGPAIAWSTFGVAVPLIAAGIWSDLVVARSIDLAVGTILGAIGIVMQRRYKARGGS